MLGVGTVTVVADIPRHEQADSYAVDDAQSEAYDGIAVALAVTGPPLLTALPINKSTISCRASHRFDGSAAELVTVCVVVRVVVPVVITDVVVKIVLIAGVTVTFTNDSQSSSLIEDAAS